MLRIQRLSRLLIVLCACAFISAFISLVIYRVLSVTALPMPPQDVLHGIGKVQEIEALRNVCTAFVGASFDLHTRGAFLASWGLWFVLLWSVILGSVAVALHRQLPISFATPIGEEKATFLDRAFAGQLELWKVFWGFYATFSILLLFVVSNALQLLMKTGVVQSSSLISAIAMPMAMSVPATIYFLSAILVWRCARNTSRTLWHYLAKTAVIGFTVMPLLRGLYGAITLFRY